MKSLSLAVLLLVTVCGVAYGERGMIDPVHCSVLPADVMSAPRVIGVPSDGPGAAIADLAITIRDTGGNPIPDCYVDVVFHPTCDDPDPLCVCASAVLSGVTDGQGFVRIHVRAGGCCLGTDVVYIRASYLVIRAYRAVVSPDFDGTRGDCQVGLADFVHFASGYTHTDVPCLNLDGDADEACTLNDFVEFAGAYARSCAGD